MNEEQNQHLSIGTHCAEQEADDDAGFILARSRKAKQAEKKAAALPISPASRRGNGTVPRPRNAPSKTASPRKQNSHGPTRIEGKQKKGVTAFDKAFYELRRWIRERADLRTILVLFARVQRLFRTKEQEARYTFARVFEEGVREEELQLRAILEEWLAEEKIWIPDFQARLKTIRFKATASEPVANTSVSWRDKLVGHTVATTTDADVTMTADSSGMQVQDWTVNKRELTAEERGVIQGVLRGNAARDQAVECVKATHELATHAVLSSAQDSETRGFLVVQLAGNMRLADTATLEGRMRILGGITPDQITKLAQFKQELYNIQYEAPTNRLVFIMKTKESASKWDQTQLIVQNRIMDLKRPRTEDDQDVGETVALTEYDLTCWEPAGVLDAFQLWHLFHGLLKIKVKTIQHAPQPLGSPVDPTQWRVTMESKGCPLALKDKTRVQWQGHTIWLHHHVFYSTPPCHRCGHPQHQAKLCTTTGTPYATGSMEVHGPLMEISDDKRLAAKVTDEDMDEWLRDLARRHTERSAMAGEDHEVGDCVPTGAVSKFIGQTDPMEVRRRVFARRCQAAEVWCSRVVNNLHRLANRYVTDYRFRMHVYYSALQLPLPYWYAVDALTSEQREARYWEQIVGGELPEPQQYLPDPANLQQWVAPVHKIARPLEAHDQQYCETGQQKADECEDIVMNEDRADGGQVNKPEIEQTSGKFVSSIQLSLALEEEMAVTETETPTPPDAEDKGSGMSRSSTGGELGQIATCTMATAAQAETEGEEQRGRQRKRASNSPSRRVRHSKSPRQSGQAKTQGFSGSTERSQAAQQVRASVKKVDVADMKQRRKSASGAANVRGASKSPRRLMQNPSTTEITTAVPPDTRGDDVLVAGAGEVVVLPTPAPAEVHDDHPLKLEHQDRAGRREGRGKTLSPRGKLEIVISSVGAEAASGTMTPGNAQEASDKDEGVKARRDITAREGKSLSPRRLSAVDNSGSFGVQSTLTPVQTSATDASGWDAPSFELLPGTPGPGQQPASSGSQRGSSRSPKKKSETPKYSPYPARAKATETPICVDDDKSKVVGVDALVGEKALAKQLTLTKFCKEVDMAQAELLKEGQPLEQTAGEASAAGLFVTARKFAEATVVPDFSQHFTKVDHWLELLSARSVDVPANGHCYYYALHAIKTGNVIGERIGVTEFTVSEAVHYRENVNGTLQGCLQPWINNGTLHWKDMYRSVVGSEPPQDERLGMLLIRCHLAKAREADPRVWVDQWLWAGPEHIKATAAWFREIMYVVNVGVDRDAHTMMYRIATTKNGQSEYVREDMLDAATFFQHLMVYIEHQVLPLVLLLHHTPGTTKGATIGHFTAVRFQEAAYAVWNKPNPAGDMRTRMDKAHRALGLPIISRTPPQQIELSAASYGAESEYVPSGLDSTDEADGQHSPPTTRSSTISVMELDKVLEALNPDEYQDRVTNPTWRQIQATHERNFMKWRHDARLHSELTTKISGRSMKARAACQILMEDPAVWLEFMRHLEYPEVMLAQLSERERARMAKELLCDAHDYVVHTAIGDNPSKAVRQMVATWIAAVHVEQGEVRWGLAYGSTHWTRLGKMTELAVAKPGLPHADTTLPPAPETAWCSLVAILLCLPGTYPDEWANETLVMQCVRLIQWLETPENQPLARDTLTNIRHFNWTGLRQLLSDPISVINTSAHVADKQRALSQSMAGAARS